MAIETASELAAKCKEVAQNHKTLYVMGCFGAPMTAANKERYCQNHSYNRKTTRTVMIKSATASTFGFDCVCLIKGILWGWNGNTSKTYGGATYGSNGVPDISADQMITKCREISTNFSGLEVGELLWMSGHVGIYIGDGLAVECTPAWKNGVQITAVLNIGAKAGYNGRRWTKHGKLPYVTYDGGKVEDKKETTSTPTASNTTNKTSEGEKNVTVKLSVLSRGDYGPQVKTLQQLLIAKGFSLPKYGADGDFGEETDTALRKFQKARNLGVDGSCGPATWTEILTG